ncbi:MAG TPA: hypothetical protein VJT81_06635 [Burkholderiales bacterium]|nr:hypothetical protein [Burkholderiales bacterium]
MRTFELDVQAVKLRILRMAEREDLDSAVLLAALADVVGLTGATADKHVGFQPFDDRIDSFVERARAAYVRINLAMQRTSLQQPGLKGD